MIIYPKPANTATTAPTRTQWSPKPYQSKKQAGKRTAKKPAQPPLYFNNLNSRYFMFTSITFKEKVLAVVARIPRGTMLTYKQVATKAGSQNASRAVGNVLKENFNLKIPCHRVIHSDGRLGRYNRGGEKRKRELLKAEGVISN